MDMSIQGLVRAAINTIKDPREGAQEVMRLTISLRQRWEILFLIIVLSAALAQITFMMFGGGDVSLGQSEIMNSPLQLGMVQLCLMVSMVYGIHHIGRRLGGTGEFGDTIMLVAWLQFIMICLQVVQTTMLAVFPFVAMLLGLFGFFLFFRLLTIFISELHGFESIPKILAGIAIAMILFAVAMSFVLGYLGLTITGV